MNAIETGHARRAELWREKNALGPRGPHNEADHDRLRREIEGYERTYVHECDQETVAAIRAAGLLIEVGAEPHPEWNGVVCVVFRKDHAEALSLISATTNNRHVAFGARSLRNSLGK